MKLSIKTGGIKFIIGWVLVLLIRLIPFRPANFEPMLASIMPYSKRYTALSSFLFGFLGIFIFDILTSKIGMWTLITALCYGGLGLGAFIYFRNKEANTKNFLIFGIVGTIIYDAITGLSVGPLFFGQSFYSALVGQIPFTLMHLLGTSIFAVILSPILYRWVIKNDTLEISILYKKILDQLS